MDVQKTSKNSINIYISSFVSSSLNWIVNQVWASVASFKMVSDYISHLEAGQGDRPDRPIPAGPRFTFSPRYSRKQHHGIYRLSYLLQGSVNRRVLWGSWPRSQFCLRPLSSLALCPGIVKKNAFGMKIWSLAMQQYISSFISLLFTLDDESGVVSYWKYKNMLVVETAVSRVCP